MTAITVRADAGHFSRGASNMARLIRLGLAVGAIFFGLDAAVARAAVLQQYEQVAGCTLQPHATNDGDSFVARLPDGRSATLRLYFVDAGELHLSGKRSRRQARYFRVNVRRVPALGREAQLFTARALAEPFTIFTRWQSIFDDGRYFAFVRTAGDKDLAEVLVRNGLAVLHSGRADTPYGRDSRSQYRRLKELERLAQREQLGGWSR